MGEGVAGFLAVYRGVTVVGRAGGTQLSISYRLTQHSISYRLALRRNLNLKLKYFVVFNKIFCIHAKWWKIFVVHCLSIQLDMNV